MPNLPGPSGYGASAYPQSPSAASQSQDPDEQRFAELLKPIKDLTVNWEVPLGRYLQNYFEEISELSLNLDNGQRVNFVEAALLLQGTASIYSKKVEFLWQNVLKMLDLLASRKALEEAADGNVDGKSKRSKKGHDINEFTPVACEMSQNVNMKVDMPVQGAQHRKTTINFISVTPRQLIEKEGREAKAVRVNIYASKGAKELLGHKEDFRVNAQFSLSLGTVGEELGYECDLAEQSVSLCDESDTFMATSLLQPMHVSPSTQPGSEKQSPRKSASTSVTEKVPDKFDQLLSQSAKTNSIVAPSTTAEPPLDGSEGDNFDPVPMHDDFDPSDDHELVEGLDLNKNEETLKAIDEGSPEKQDDNLRRSKRIRRNRHEESLNEPKAPLTNPWEPIKPHEASNVVKPVKKGKTCRAPKNLVLKKGSSRSKKRKADEDNPEINREPIEPIDQYLIHGTVTKSYSNMGKLHGVDPAFQEQAFEEGKNRKQRLKAGVNPASQDNDGENDEDNDGWEDVQFEGGNDDPFEDMDDPRLGNSFHVPGEAAVSADDDADTYEDLVMKRVADYVQQSQEYIQSTDLAKKVSKWHEDIGPRLEKVEQRASFDIHKYGSDIISTFPETKAKTTVSFNNVVQGKDKEEVCRYFLSSLMLANTYNVELSTPEVTHIDTPTKKGKKRTDAIIGGFDTQLPMDNLQLTLLSTRMHHEEMMTMGYSDPDPSASSQPSSSSSTISTPATTTGPEKDSKGKKRKVQAKKKPINQGDRAAEELIE